MIYVDQPIYARAGVKNPRVTYAHMVADTIQELHAFAKQIGIKPHFFHRSPAAHHYDINATQQYKAINAGAQLVTSREILKIGKKATQESLT